MVVVEDGETIILEVTEDRLEVVAVAQGVQMLLLVMAGQVVEVFTVRGAVLYSVRHSIIIVMLQIPLLALLALKVQRLEMVVVTE